MVRNDFRSLRGSSSNISLRSSAEEAGRQRIIELEARIANLMAQNPTIHSQPRTLYEEAEEERYRQLPGELKHERSLFEGFRYGQSVDDAPIDPAAYTKPFCEFLTDNPTIWHAVLYFEKQLEKAGFKKVCTQLQEESF